MKAVACFQCHLLLPPAKRQDLLTLHFPGSSPQPYHFSYAIYNLPRDGSCPAAKLPHRHARLGATAAFNTTVRVRTSEWPEGYVVCNVAST